MAGAVQPPCQTGRDFKRTENMKARAQRRTICYLFLTILAAELSEMAKALTRFEFVQSPSFFSRL